jgi:hypothetical protein
MTKLRLLGAAVIFSVLAGPAMAKHVIHKTAHHVRTAACDPRDPGNPFSQKYDYMAWSAWRRRGSWDDRADYTCQPIPSY